MRTPKPWFRKANSTWYVQLDGRQHNLGTSKAGADLAFHRLMADRGRAEPLKETPLAQLLDAFLDDVQRSHPKSYDWYRVFLQDFLNGHRKLKAKDVTEKMVRDWVTGPHPRPWGLSTQRSAITVLKRVMNWGVEAKLLTESPIRFVKRPPAQRRKKVLTAEQRAEILSWYPEGDPFRDFLVAMMESGCRPGEVMKVTAADVNLTVGVWVLHGKTTDRTGKDRIVYMTPVLLELTKRLMGHRPTGPLFLNEDGNPWNRQAVNCRLRRKRKRGMLEKGVVNYTLRHSFTTDALEKGVPIATVAELLGHQGTAVISSNYSHLSERTKHLRDAAEKATKDS